VSIDGVTPSAATAEDNSYMLSRPLFIYSDAGIIAERPQVGSFINYYLNSVNDVIGGVGYFPASDFAINLSKLQLLAAMSNAGM
jgi:phosphate transport system substrate-binding protein